MVWSCKLCCYIKKRRKDKLKNNRKKQTNMRNVSFKKSWRANHLTNTMKYGQLRIR